MKSLNKVFFLAGGGFILLFQLGCGENIRDGNYARNQTGANLKEWGYLIEFVIKNRLDDPFQYSSCQEALTVWAKKKYISFGSISILQTDGWGRLFLWKTSKKGAKKVIKIRSLGKNGKSKEEDPDSLFIEITSKEGKVTVRFGKEI